MKKLHLFDATAFRQFINSEGVAQFDELTVSALRMQMFCHIILNLGCQMFLLKDTATGMTSPSPYVAPLLQTMLNQILTSLCVEGKPFRERLVPELELLAQHSKKTWFETCDEHIRLRLVDRS